MLYKSYVRSVIEYRIGLWYPRGYKEKLKLERIQYAGIRKAMGYRCSTPTNMLAEAKVIRIEDRAKYLVNNLIIENLMYENQDLKEKLNILKKN